MKEEDKTGCTELARITLPWASKILNYCPVHANQIAAIGQAMGAPIQAQMLPSTSTMGCESNDSLTDEQKKLAKTFTL